MRLSPIYLAGTAAGLLSGCRMPSPLAAGNEITVSFPLPSDTTSSSLTQTNIDRKTSEGKVLQITSPLYGVFKLDSGGFPLLYCIESFYRKHNAWPKDHTELSTFVQQSNGYLMLSNYYDRVDFKLLPDDGLQVFYVCSGDTNTVEFKLKDISKK